MRNIIRSIAAASLACFAGASLAEPTRFDSPEAAVAALVAALEARDKAGVLAIFGPENEDVISTGDSDKDKEIWGRFLTEIRTISRVEMQGEDRAILHAGRESWPFPTPLVRAEGGWSFDAEAGREEILMRRIGHNELAVIDIMRRARDVQAEYRRVDHDGDGVMEFAASILSAPGARDGLYWPDEAGLESSPFDETVARATLTGYSRDGEDREAEPLEGYYFRILQGQGDSAPGGAYSYMVAQNMVAGHAMLAVPAAYGDTGVMSFMVGEGGVIYESDLGEDTLETATGIEVFDPGEGWSEVD